MFALSLSPPFHLIFRSIMGKIRKESQERQFYKKKSRTNDSAVLLPSEATSTFKFKPVQNVTPTTAQTVVSTSSTKQSTKKKLKQQQRKENLIKKISVTQPPAKKRKQLKTKIKKQKQQVARVTTLSDLTSLKNALPSLNDSLPSLNSLFMLKTSAELKTGVPQFDKKLQTTGDTTPKKLTKAMKTKHKKKVFMKRYDYLQKLMSDKAFKRNPREVIAAHVRNRRVIEENFENKKPRK